jgi:hypothetical protein
VRCDSGKVRVYDELTSGDAVVDLSPSQALSRAESFLIGQGYVVAHRTLTTLMAERKGSEGPPGQGERVPKVVVVTVPQPDGGVNIKVGGDDREGVQERKGLWKLWAENLPKRRP